MTKTFFMVARSFSQAKEARMHFHSSQRSTILPVELPCDNAGPMGDGVRQCVLCVVGQWREQKITAKHYLSFHATDRSVTLYARFFTAMQLSVRQSEKKTDYQTVR